MLTLAPFDHHRTAASAASTDAQSASGRTRVICTSGSLYQNSEQAKHAMGNICKQALSNIPDDGCTQQHCAGILVRVTSWVSRLGL